MGTSAIDLRNAGFTDNEIIEYFKRHSKDLKKAGFSDYQISNYLGLQSTHSLNPNLDISNYRVDKNKNPFTGEPLNIEEIEKKPDTQVDSSKPYQQEISKLKYDFTDDLTKEFDKSFKLFETDEEGRLKYMKDTLTERYPNINLEGAWDHITYDDIKKRVEYQHTKNIQIETNRIVDREWKKKSAQEKIDLAAKVNKIATEDDLPYSASSLITGQKFLKDRSSKFPIVDQKWTTGSETVFLLNKLKVKHNATNEQVQLVNIFLDLLASLESSNRNTDSNEVTNSKRGYYQIPENDLPDYVDSYWKSLRENFPIGSSRKEDRQLGLPRWVRMIEKDPNKLTELTWDQQKALVVAKLLNNPDADRLLKGMLSDDIDAKIDALEEFYFNYMNPVYVTDADGKYVKYISDAGNEKLLVEQDSASRKMFRKAIDKLTLGQIEYVNPKLSYLPQADEGSEIFSLDPRGSGVFETGVSKFLDVIESVSGEKISGRSEFNIFDVGRYSSGTGLIALFENEDISKLDKEDILYRVQNHYLSQSFGPQVAADILSIVRDLPLFAGGCWMTRAAILAAVGVTRSPIAGAMVCGAGAFGFQGYTHKLYTEMLMNHEVEDFEEFMNIGAKTNAFSETLEQYLPEGASWIAQTEGMATELAKHGIKHAGIGAATMGAGGYMRGKAAKYADELELLYNPTKSKLYKHSAIPAEIVTLVSLNSAMYQEMPTARDFVKAAVVIYGLHGIMNTPQMFMRIFKDYGVKPEQLVKLIEKHPNLREDIRDGNFTWFEHQQTQLSNKIWEVIEKHHDIKLLEYKPETIHAGEKVNVGGAKDQSGIVTEVNTAKQDTALMTIELENRQKIIVDSKDVSKQTINPNAYQSSTVKDIIENAETSKNIDATIRKEIVKDNQLLNKKEFLRLENQLLKDQELGYMSKNIELFVKPKRVDAKMISEKYKHNKVLLDADAKFRDISTIVRGKADILYVLKEGDKKYLVIKPIWEAAAPDLKYSTEFFSSPMYLPIEAYYAGLKAAGQKSEFSIMAYKKNWESISEKDINASFYFADPKYNQFVFDQKGKPSLNKKHYKVILHNHSKDLPGVTVDLSLKQSGSSLKEFDPAAFNENATYFLKKYRYGEGKDYTYGTKVEDVVHSKDGYESRNIPDEPPVTPSSEINYRTDQFIHSPKGLDLMDMVQIIKALTAKAPSLKHLKQGTLGQLLYKEGTTKGLEVRITRELQKDPERLLMTMAHELGHAIDFIKSSKYFENNTFKGQNLIGKIANLKESMNAFLDSNNPSSPVSKNYIKNLRKNAEIVVREQKENLDVGIQKDFGHLLITPKTILDIYKTTDARAKIDPEFYNAFVTLSRDLKKDITRHAMKKLMHPHLKALADKINKKITNEHTVNAEEAFAKAFEQQLYNRGIVSEEVIRRELIKLTHEWKPFDPKVEGKEHTDYRYSNNELMADFMMAFLLRPRWTELNAPYAYAHWMKFMSHKKQIHKEWMDIQNLLVEGREPRLQSAVDNIKKSFVKGREDAVNNMIDQKLTADQMADRMGQFIHTNHFWIYRRLGIGTQWSKTFSWATQKRFKDELAAEVQQAIIRTQYAGSWNEFFLSEFRNKVFRPLEKKGYSIDDLGVMLLVKNLVYSKQRAEMASPFGLMKVEKDAALKVLKGRSPEEMLTYLRKNQPGLEPIADTYWEVYHRELFERGEIYKWNLFDQNMLDSLQANKMYITYATQEGFLNAIKNYGTHSSVTAKIKQSLGTFKDIQNPAYTTIQKALILNYIGRQNKEKSLIMNWLYKNDKIFQEFFRDARGNTLPTVRKVEYKKGKKKVPENIKPAPDGWDIITWSERGDIKSAYVSKYLANIYKENWMSDHASYFEIFAKPFQYMFTTVNPAFIIGANLPRDMTRTAIFNPQVRLLDMIDINQQKALKVGKNYIQLPGLTIKYYPGERSLIRKFLKNLPATWVSIYGQIESPFLRKMYKQLGIKESEHYQSYQFLNYVLRNGYVMPKEAGFRGRIESGRMVFNFEKPTISTTNTAPFLKITWPKIKVTNENIHEIQFQKSVTDYIFKKTLIKEVGELYKNNPITAVPLTIKRIILDPVEKFGQVIERDIKVSSAEILYENHLKAIKPDIAYAERQQLSKGLGKIKLSPKGESEARLTSRIVNSAGSPNFLDHGRGHALLNSMVLYFNSWQKGMGSDWKTWREEPWRITGNALKYHGVPWAIALGMWFGLFGEDNKDMIDAIPDYDFENYNVLPLGVTSDGRVVYLRWARDEATRLNFGLLTKLIRTQTKEAGGFDKFLSDMTQFGFESGTPATNPILQDFVDDMIGIIDDDYDIKQFKGWSSIDQNILNMLSKEDLTAENLEKNPELRELLKQRGIDPDELARRLADPNLKGLLLAEKLKAFANKYSGSGFYKFRGVNVDEVRMEMDEIFNIGDTPVFGPIMNRYIKISEHPLTTLQKRNKKYNEKISNTLKVVRHMKIKQWLETPHNNSKEYKKIQTEGMESLIELAINGSLKENALVRNMLAKYMGEAWLEDFLGPMSVAERQVFIQQIQQRLENPYNKKED